MSFSNIIIGVFAIVATVVIFLFSRFLNQRFPHPLTLPVLISTILVASGLLLFNIPYETYRIGGQWIEFFLGPAVVALAYPLYRQWGMIIKNAVPIFVGVFAGAFIGVASGLLLGKWLGLDELIILSVLPKSVTAPVAMDIADTIKGSAPLAAVMVMFAGIGGSVIGPTLFRVTRIHHQLAKGLGMGSASHAIGTAKAMESSLEAGAASTVAMILSAIIVSIITPFFV